MQHALLLLLRSRHLFHDTEPDVLLEASVRSLVLAGLLALGIAFGCNGGPVPPGASAGVPTAALVVTVHNLDVAYAETATVSWWVASTVLASQAKLMPAGGEASFYLPVFPDGLEVDTVAWPAQAGGLAFGSPDYRGARVFHVCYPTQAFWIEH